MFKVAGPRRRIVAGAVSADLGNVEHRLDVTPQQAGAGRVALPHGFEHRHHVRRGDLVDPQAPQGFGIALLANRALPPRHRLVGPNRWRALLYEGVGRLPEGRDFTLGPPSGDRITSSVHQFAHELRLLARSPQSDRGRRTQPGLASPASGMPHEHPRTCGRPFHTKVEPRAVRIHACGL